MSDPQNHAIVFGATGLIGWAAVNQLYLDEKRAALEIWEKELNERIEKFTQ